MVQTLDELTRTLDIYDYYVQEREENTKNSDAN